MLIRILALDPFDGKIGINFIIITLNFSITCKPLLGNREVYMQENFHYGHDDPLQWPQAYIKQFPCLACICWVSPALLNDPFYPLYRGLTKYDFVESDPNSIVKGVGHLHHSMFLKIQTTCQVVIKSMNSIDASEPVACSLHGHLSAIEMLLAQLHALLTSFLHVHLTFAETQHVTLELWAFVDYMTMFKPLIDSPESNMPTMPVNSSLLGAFVYDAMVLQRFFKAGIPVW
ncbi:uncharacterized protein EV420DRAFT_1648653 [Desarmillaria tabescens]|uniref:Uncharacterized protein n=1 Tax=Armillaria tabescens TaxID=1929756 RepID=A0AA39MRZ8_ARMTA|nr:uncharacterized protein EV420DRAFT_1648653 [Desarmillaria tabescens]KAK0444931.1 hypothetical protein EV420DRAFT_1648653 [Desarmillaria tabescens]